MRNRQAFRLTFFGMAVSWPVYNRAHMVYFVSFPFFNQPQASDHAKPQNKAGKKADKKTCKKARPSVNNSDIEKHFSYFQAYEMHRARSSGGERYVDIVEVPGSIPGAPTNKIKHLRRFLFFTKQIWGSIRGSIKFYLLLYARL